MSFSSPHLLALGAPTARASLFLGASVLAALTWSGCGEGPAASQAALPAAPPPEVSIVTVEPTAVEIEELLPGRVAPRRIAEVRPQVGGVLRERLFEEGEVVRAGQPLYRIDSSMFRAELAGASATVARQEAALEQRERDAERTARLLERGTATPQNMEDAESARALARADLELSRAAQQRSRLQLAYSTVVAPIAGRIGISHVSEGTLVSPSSVESLATIQQIDEVYVDIRQPASRFEELRTAFTEGSLVQNESVPITIVSMRGEPYDLDARLLFTDISVDPSTSELMLRVLVPNAEMRLLPGMFVRARVAFGRDPAALLVPQQAVRRDSTLGANVLVVGDNEELAVRRIETGRVVRGMQIVRAGLSPGDRVVVEGIDALRPGMRVRPVEWVLPPPPGAAPDAEQTASTDAPSNDPPPEDAPTGDGEGASSTR